MGREPKGVLRGGEEPGPLGAGRRQDGPQASGPRPRGSGLRAPREPYEGYLASKKGDCPGLSRRRLFREIQERGYEGSYTVGRIISARSGWMRRSARAGRPCGADSSLDRARKPPERGSCERQGTCRILKKSGFSARHQIVVE